jgi:pulcherriminic acid synthase
MSALPEILSPEFAADPYAAYTVFREEYPLFWHEGMQTYVVSRYEDVERCFKDPTFTTNNYSWQLEPVHGRTLMQMDGTEHAKQRSLVTPAFRGHELTEKFVPIIQRNSQELVDQFAKSGHVELVSAYATRFPINVIIDMLDLPREDHQSFKNWYESIIAFLSNLSGDPAVTEKGLQTKVEFQEYMTPLIQLRRQNPGDDLLSTLCNAEIDGQHMTDEEIKSFCSLLLTAGGETTDKALTLLFRNLVQHPDQMAAVRKDRSLIGNAFAETLRMSPPVQMLMRQPSSDVELLGGTVESGKTVTALIGSAHRDPRKYKDPDTFNIFREDLDVAKAFSGAANHIAFALGRHFCVGAILAKTEIEIGTNMLLDAMEDIRFSPGFNPIDEGVFVRSPKKLELDFTPAN